MTLSSTLKQKIDCDGPELSDDSISKFLWEAKWGLSDLAELSLYLVSKDRLDLAMKVFAKWTEVTPDNPEPWTNLGWCLARQHQIEDARQVLEYALEIDSLYLPAMNNLSEVYQQLGEHELQLKNCLTAVNQHPSSALSFNNLGAAFVDLGMFEEAKHAFKTSLLLDPLSFEPEFNLAKIASREGDQHLALHYLENSKGNIDNNNTRQIDLFELQLGIEYLICGRLEDGWKLYEKGFSSGIPSSLARRPRREFMVPQWQGQFLLPDKRLMVWGEQGIGDELRFGTLLPELKNLAGQVVIECDPRLVNAIQRSFPTFHVRASPSNFEHLASAGEYDYDFHLPIGSLAGFYMQSPEIFSHLGGYLQPSAFQSAKYAQRLSEFDGFKKIGICWRSHQLSATRNKKYTTLEDWSDILSTPNVVFVNLQYGECEQELVDAERRHGIKILRWSDTDLKDDLEAVMGIMKNLDLVISPSTAVVPLAGAIGRKTIFIGHPTWVMLGEKTRYPWFSSVHPVLVDKTKPVASGLPEAKRLMDCFLSGVV
jgi:Tfp pilus assembly protein PilF